MIDTYFNLEWYHASLRDLQGAAPQNRVTANMVHQNGALQFGTLLVGSNQKEGLYTTEDQAILGRAPLPFTTGLMWLEGTDGLEHQLAAVVGLHRLQHIKQLSLLGFPVKQGTGHMSIDFRHTRFLHTYDVVLHGLLCAHNANVSGKDLVALNIALGIHDLFTPFCGDLMKFVDYKGFDEDTHLSTLLEHPRYLDMCQKLGVDPHEPIRICQEKEGILCQIRDFADTLAYTARDLSIFLEYFRTPQKEDREVYEDAEEQLLLEELLRYTNDRGDFALLFEDIHTDADGNIYFTNPERLQQFLRIRAILFRILYYNRQTRNVEYLLGIRFVKILLEERILNHDQFLSEHSYEDSVWQQMYRTTGYNPAFMHNGSLGITHEFSSFELAKRYVQKISSENTCGLIYKWPSQTKSKVNYWKVGTPDGVIPWGEAFPKEAAEIEKIMWLHHGFHVAIIDREHLHQISQEYWDKLKALETSIL